MIMTKHISKILFALSATLVALICAIAAPQVVDDAEIVVLVEVFHRRNPTLGETADIVGQAGEEGRVLVSARDQKALRHQDNRKGDPDAGIVVGLERLARVSSRRR